MEEQEEKQPKTTRTNRGGYRQKENGTWQKSAMIDGKRKWFPGKTKKEAGLKAAEAITAAAKGTYIEPSKMTLRWYYEEEYLPGAKRSLAEATLKNYENLWAWRISPYPIADMVLSTIRPGHISSWLSTLEEKGRQDGGPLSDFGVTNSYTRLTTILNHAVSQGSLGRNPCTLLEHKPTFDASKDDRDWWDSDTLAEFLSDAMVVGYRMYGLLALELDTGMRRGELCGLRWHSLNLEAGTVTIEWNRTRISGVKIKEGQPKSRRGKPKSTTLSLSEPTVAILRSWRKTQLEERFFVGGKWQGADYVFTTAVHGKGSGPGRPYSPEGLADVWLRIRDRWIAADPSRASLPRPSTHELRHSYASAMLDAGEALDVVAARLTHSGTRMVETLYGHRTAKAGREAANRVAGILHRTADAEK